MHHPIFFLKLPYTMIFLKWTKLNRYCSACIHPKRLHNVSSKRPLKTVFDIVMALGQQPQRGQCPMVPPNTMNTPFCLFLSVCLLPSLPGPPSGSEALTVDSESFLDGPSLSQITPRLYQRAQRLTQVAQRPSQVAQRPSQLAQSPSQLDLRPSQLALRPSQSQLAPSPSQPASSSA